MAVKVNVAVPGPTAVTTPVVGLTVATVVLLLAQVPPVVGDKVVVKPTQIWFGPVIATTGLFITSIGDVGNEGHVVVADVNTKVALPTDKPVTRPLLFTLAIAGCKLVQVPPVVGDNVDVKPTQIGDGPVTLTTGLG